MVVYTWHAASATSQGNLFYKEGKYEAAIAAYTKSMEFDPFNAILPANRAMAQLNMKRLIFISLLFTPVHC